MTGFENEGAHEKDNSESHEAAASFPASDASGAGKAPESVEPEEHFVNNGSGEMPSNKTSSNADAEGQDVDAAADEVMNVSAGQAATEDSEEIEEPLSDPLTEAMDSLARLEDQLARRNADMYNLEQEYSSYVRRSKAEAVSIREAGISAVVEALLPVLDDVELARQHGDLQGPFLAIAEKLESSLNAGFGVERFGKVGDPFDPHVHEALMHSTSADIVSEQIGTLIQPGYRIGERILRAARVGVVSPE